jgi:N-acetylneuraminic acid mutarotase
LKYRGLRARATCTVAIAIVGFACALSALALAYAQNADFVSDSKVKTPYARLQVKPGSLSFKKINLSIGRSSETKVLTLEDTGTAPLTVTVLTLSGNGNAVFAITSGCRAIALQPHGEATVTVGFQPSMAEKYSAVVSILATSSSEIKGKGAVSLHLTGSAKGIRSGAPPPLVNSCVSPTPTATAIPTPSATLTGTPIATTTTTRTVTMTPTPTATGTPTVTVTSTSARTSTSTPTAAGTLVPTMTLTSTSTLPATSTPTLTATPTATPVTLALGSVVIIGGQRNSSQTLASVETYSYSTGIFVSSGSFPVAGSMFTPRYSHTATLLQNGKVLLVGGQNAKANFLVSSGPQALGSAELYDPTNGTFTATGSLITPRAYHTATLLQNGQVLIAGGADQNGNALSLAEIYDPTTGSFSGAPDIMNAPRVDPTATLLTDGRVLLTGGLGGGTAPVATASAEVYDPVAGKFISAGIMSSARFGHTATILANGQVLVAGGSPALGVFTNPNASADVFDPLALTFIPTGSLQIARINHSATLLADGTVLIAGGFPPGDPEDDEPASTTPAAEIYDPAMGTFTPTGSMNEPRQGHGAVLLSNGLVLVAGGDSNQAYSGMLSQASAELYDPSSGEFTATGGLADDRGPDDSSNGVYFPGATTTLLSNGNVLLTGGVQTGISQGTNGLTGQMYPPIATEIYDPSSASFRLGATLNIYRFAGHTATSLDNGDILVAGGIPHSLITDTAELLEQSSAGSFRLTGTMTTPRFQHTATLLDNGKLLVAGGVTNFSSGNPATSSSELYNPASFTFNPTGSLSTARIGHTATLLSSGQVLMAGGQGNFGDVTTVTGTAELFDPSTGFYSSTGNLQTARADHTATLLLSGKVLIAGGGGLGGTRINPAVELSSAELYDPATGTFTATGNMTVPRLLHTATLLPSGQVLITGGTSDATAGGSLQGGEPYDPDPTLLAGTLYSSAELYDPDTGMFTATGNMNDARGRHTATLLPTGQVLIVGGEDNNQSWPANVELYDPPTGAFMVGSRLVGGGRWFHTATLETTSGMSQSTLPSNLVSLQWPFRLGPTIENRWVPYMRNLFFGERPAASSRR